jgi:hypothetical protein
LILFNVCKYLSSQGCVRGLLGPFGFWVGGANANASLMGMGRQVQ